MSACTPGQLGRTAGVALLAMAVIAGFSFGMVFSGLLKPGNNAATAADIRASGSLYGWAIAGLVVILLLDVIVAITLYGLLGKQEQKRMWWSAMLRVLYAAILGISLLPCVEVIPLLHVAPSPETDSELTLALVRFTEWWSWGLILFGFHLLVLGFVVYRHPGMPRLMGIALSVGGFLYVLTNGLQSSMPGYAAIKPTVDAVLGLPMALGELWLAVWLLARSNRMK